VAGLAVGDPQLAGRKDPVLERAQGCGSGSGFNRVSGSGSRRAKMTLKSREIFKSSCFEVMDDGLF
jgi:hypothetical protein